MRSVVTRYTCDAPKCEDVVEIPAPPDTATVQMSTPTSLPDGWIELNVSGASPGGQQELVHASRPECAARLAEAQVERAVEAAEIRAKEEEEARKRAEKATEEAQEAEAEQTRRAGADDE